MLAQAGVGAGCLSRGGNRVEVCAKNNLYTQCAIGLRTYVVGPRWVSQWGQGAFFKLLMQASVYINDSRTHSFSCKSHMPGFLSVVIVFFRWLVLVRVLPQVEVLLGIGTRHHTGAGTDSSLAV